MNICKDLEGLKLLFLSVIRSFKYVFYNLNAAILRCKSVPIHVVVLKPRVRSCNGIVGTVSL